MIEAAIFAHDDNHVLDGGSGGDFVDGFVRISLRLGQRPKAKDLTGRTSMRKEKLLLANCLYHCDAYVLLS